MPPDYPPKFSTCSVALAACSVIGVCPAKMKAFVKGLVSGKKGVGDPDLTVCRISINRELISY